MSSSGLLEGLTLFTENTGLVVGRTLVDPSKWSVPVLVEAVVVESFSEVGMVAQISAIQSITEPHCRTSCEDDSLPTHLQELLDQTSRDLDGAQQCQLASVLLQYSDLFPVPGSTLTGHTDALEHDIDTGHSTPIRCAPRRMSPQKFKKEEECFTGMLAGGQIEPSDSPWLAPVVLVTKKGLRWSRCLVYLDDIISFGTTFLDALDNLTLIFERLRAYDLQLKSSKCHLFQTSVPFLGHIVGRRGLECDPRKIEDVKSWPVPDCLKSVCQFLGFVGYYRRFIPNFADHAAPLVALTARTSLSCGDRSVRTHSTVCAIPSFRPRSWPSLQRQDCTYWTRTPVISGWVLSQIQNNVEHVVAYCRCASGS